MVKASCCEKTAGNVDVRECLWQIGREKMAVRSGSEKITMNAAVDFGNEFGHAFRL